MQFGYPAHPSRYQRQFERYESDHSDSLEALRAEHEEAMGRAARQYAEAKEKLEQQLAAAEALLGDVIKREGGQAQELATLREEAQQLKEEGTERVDRCGIEEGKEGMKAPEGQGG